MLESILEKIIPKHKESVMNRYLRIKYKVKLLGMKSNTKDVDVFLVGTPEYGNLGDHAIAKAEGKLLMDIGKKHCEITSTSIMYSINEIKKIIKDRDIIITGGGFLGSIWMNEERMVRTVIESFPNNKIIIFPQTIFYEKTEQGDKEKNNTLNLYRNHKNLHIYAREGRTYEFLKEELSEDSVKLVPDIVLYLNMTKREDIERSKILVCIRKDKELTKNKLIEEFLQENNKETIYADTVVNYRVTLKNREKELEKIFEKFKRSSLVVTNRLHGMIFAAITATPCICFDNITKKVSGVYKWINSLEYIKMVNEKTTKEELRQFVQNIKDRKFTYNEKKLLKSYEILIKDIENMKKV